RALLQSAGVSIQDVGARSAAGEAAAITALEETARYLCTGLAIIINTLNPSQIFVGGEIADAWDRLAPIIHDVIATRALTPPAAQTPIPPEPAASHPRLRGAAALVAAPT